MPNIEMDNAAHEAALELQELDLDATRLIADWMNKWYLKAGYRRLGRVLKEYSGKNSIEKGNNQHAAEVH